MVFDPGQASALDGSLFPEGYCRDTAPLVNQAALGVVAQIFPAYVDNVAGSLAGAVPLREIPKDKALALMAESSLRRYGIADFLTDAEFRGDCVYYLGEDTLKAVYDAFEMNIATPLAGLDRDEHPFRMTAMVVGRDKVGLLYDRERVTYYNERSRRTLSFRQKVFLDLGLSEDGSVKYLDRINGLSVDTGFPYGWESIEAMRQTGGKVQSYVLGKWRSPTPVHPIAQRPSKSDMMVAGCSNPEVCGMPAPAATAISLRMGFSSLDALRGLSESKTPF
ncbi:MAG: hypothetical protein HY748_16585 [Elusimicrobia bacterium]|nr:hypothetical protein [Elusimicrobiota bacterium]